MPMPIDLVLDLPLRVQHVFEREGVRTLKDLLSIPFSTIKGWRNLGRESLIEIWYQLDLLGVRPNMGTFHFYWPPISEAEALSRPGWDRLSPWYDKPYWAELDPWVIRLRQGDIEHAVVERRDTHLRSVWRPGMAYPTCTLDEAYEEVCNFAEKERGLPLNLLPVDYIQSAVESW